MIKSTSFAFLCIMLISFSANSQKKRFNSLTEANTIVKFTPTSLFNGIIEFGVEREIGDRTSLDIGAGPTISNVSPFNNGHGIGSVVNGNGFTAQSYGSEMGFHGTVGIRFYPIEERWVMNGFYVSPTIGIRVFNYRYQDYYNFSDFSEKGYVRETRFGFLFGSQNWLSKYFGLDSYIGCGIKASNEKAFVNIYDPNSGQSQWKSQIFTDASWYLTAGIKIGIGFEDKK